MESNIDFKFVTDEDFEIIAQWRNSPEVRKWYYDYTNPDKVFTSADIASKNEKQLQSNPRRGNYIILINDIKVGYIQTYLCKDYPEENEQWKCDDTTASIDIFLAPEFQHKGYGVKIIKVFLKKIVFANILFFADKCMIAPEPRNQSAIRMYQKAGFEYVRTVKLVNEPEPEYVMLLTQQE